MSAAISILNDIVDNAQFAVSQAKLEIEKLEVENSKLVKEISKLKAEFASDKLASRGRVYRGMFPELIKNKPRELVHFILTCLEFEVSVGEIAKSKRYMSCLWRKQDQKVTEQAPYPGYMSHLDLCTILSELGLYPHPRQIPNFQTMLETGIKYRMFECKKDKIKINNRTYYRVARHFGS